MLSRKVTNPQLVILLPRATLSTAELGAFRDSNDMAQVEAIVWLSWPAPRLKSKRPLPNPGWAQSMA